MVRFICSWKVRRIREVFFVFFFLLGSFCPLSFLQLCCVLLFSVSLSIQTRVLSRSVLFSAFLLRAFKFSCCSSPGEEPLISRFSAEKLPFLTFSIRARKRKRDDGTEDTERRLWVKEEWEKDGMEKEGKSSGLSQHPSLIRSKGKNMRRENVYFTRDVRCPSSSSLLRTWNTGGEESKGREQDRECIRRE